MKSSKLMSAFIVLISFLIMTGCGDDDKKINNSGDPVPSELVATWLFSSATMNGVPISSYSEISNDDAAVTSSITFTANRTWSAVEYDQGQNVVYTESGTFTINGNQMNVTTTLEDGTPVNETYSATWAVASNTFILTIQETVDGVPMILIAVYTKS